MSVPVKDSGIFSLLPLLFPFTPEGDCDDCDENQNHRRDHADHYKIYAVFFTAVRGIGGLSALTFRCLGFSCLCSFR